MNILFLGNSLLLCSVRHLAELVNQAPDNDLFMKTVYIAQGRIYHYVNGFETPMTQKISSWSGRHPNIVWKYRRGEDKWRNETNLSKSIKDIVCERKWDAIVTCGSSQHVSGWLYEQFKDDYKRFFELLRENSDAKIYWMWTFVPSSKVEGPKSLHTLDYAYGGEKALAKDEKEMFEYLNSVDERICADNNVLPLKLRIAYEKLVEAFPSEERLIIDNIHPDRGVGEYFCSMYIYCQLLKNEIGMRPSRFRYRYDASKYQYKFSKKPNISVDSGVKRMCDRILMGLL